MEPSQLPSKSVCWKDVHVYVAVRVLFFVPMGSGDKGKRPRHMQQLNPAEPFVGGDLMNWMVKDPLDRD